ncbi:MAG: HK97-gp10 family putative phage morphogenesis protein [Chloroflexota bacterium]
MANSKVEWYGDDILAQIEESTEPALWEALGVAEQAMVANAPVDQGDLRDSAYRATSERSTYKKHAAASKEIKPKKGEGAVGFALFYARFLELGTSKLAPRPFIRPGYDATKNQMVETLVGRIRNNLE